jgi:ABC-type oligopeptide transport system substrate-binding subunit
MKKTIAALFAVVMIVAVVDVAVVAAGASPSTPHAKALSPANIKITNYPSSVSANQSFSVKGTLTSGGNGLGNKLIFGDWQDNNGAWNSGGTSSFTTSADGSFTYNWTLPSGTWSLRQEFMGDNQYTLCVSDPFTITAS